MNGNSGYDSDRSAERIGKVFVFLLMISALAFAGRKYIMPYFDRKLVEKTSSSPVVSHKITIAHDSFAGYAILRSDMVRNDMEKEGIQLIFEDDGADYSLRMKNLSEGKTDLAVFTIDAYLKTAPDYGYPAAIVAVIDESVGADAVVSFKSLVSGISDLNNPDSSMVYTQDSPSETMARVLVADFELPQLGKNWGIPEKSPEAVLERIRSKKGKKEAFALWEPYVSLALEIPDTHVIFDSSRIRGYIVDVLVANRKFLVSGEEQICSLLQAYFRALYKCSDREKMIQLLQKDSSRFKQNLSVRQSEVISNKIQWKNTLENYAHFRLADASENHLSLPEMISNISSVLKQTDAVKNVLTPDRYHEVYYDGCLKKILQSRFHPAKKLNITSDSSLSQEVVRNSSGFEMLSDENWKKLLPVGELKLVPLTFIRGSSEMNEESRLELQNLCQKLRTYPTYYMKITGHSRNIGDRQANIDLSRDRAETVKKYLITSGIPESRLSSGFCEPGITPAGGEAQSVSFQLLQKPY